MDATEADTPEHVTDRLRSDIVLGALRPGEWLRQSDLQDRYGCTRSAARSALTRLTVDRIVEHAPNRGFRVAQPSIEVRSEITEVRLTLETLAAGQVVDNAGAADISAIRSAAQAFDAGVDVLPFQQMRRLNHAFHRVFYSPLRNHTLYGLINELRERDLPNDWSNWSTSAKVRQSSSDHLDMVAALVARDTQRLCSIVRSHLTNWTEMY
ncbi:GntR family transcriptional regulator [Roseicitreum antarcticum]|uniref:DNA-binding transcriptional regulator, GntR family n=1 Tax=Roseicitreum antarcticum TaxID=564137 RepID=A0A1H2Z4Z4_9RHOB|nr:GntR family transcriptional regulator [Roseicitreum antarcticum]SDX12385.1 DNA-binding transcriptional regulator, GntR family [Roseicitreum antarcticum]